jgi:PAS domain S-box-containing protein
MPAKKKSTLALTRQRNAADKARREGRWEIAIANYTRALAHKNLSADVKMELLEGRAAGYKKTGNLKAEALDRKTLSTLLKSQLEEQNAALQQGQAELGIVASIAEALVDRADYERIGQIVGQKLQEFFDAEIASIGLFDKQSGMITVPYYYEKGKLKKVTPFKYGEGVASHVLKTRKPIYIPTAKEQEKYGVIYAKELPAESMLMAPIISGKQALGAISIQDSKPNAYSKHDLRILNAIANSMSVALENARLFDETRQRNREIAEALDQQTATSDILRAMANSPTEIQPILDAVANNAVRLCEADDAQIYSVEGKRLSQVAHCGPLPALQNAETLPLVKGLVSGRAVLERKTIHIEDAALLSKTEYPESVKLQRRLGHRTVLTTPLLRKGIAIGAITVRRDEVRPFTEKQIALLATFADQAAIAIENVRLFDQLQTRNREITEALEQQTATSDILQIIASSPEDIDGVLRAIAEKAALLLKSEDAVIFYVEGDFFVTRAHYGPIPFFRLGKDIQFNRESVAGRAIIDRRPIQAIHNSKGKKSEFPLGDKTAKHFGYALTCAAPLLFQGKTVGAIMIRRVEPTLFSEKEISLLQNFANQAVIAIEKARLLNETNRLLEETTQRNREITEALDLQTATSDILQIIASSPEDLDSILNAIAEKAALLCNSGDAVISYGEGGFLKVRAHYGSIPFLKVGERAGILDRGTVVGRAIIDRKPVQAVHNQKGRKSEFPIGDKFAKQFGYALTLAAPLLFQGNANGGIFLRRVEPVLFSEREISLLQSFANQAVIAIEKARLLNETRRLLEETTQRNREITEALELQTATSDILEVIASSPEDIDGVLNIIAEKAALLLRSDDAVINYVEGGFFNARAHYGSIPFFKLGTGTPFNTETVTGRAIIEGKPIQAIHNPKGKKSEFPLGDKAAKQFGYALTCAAPLLFQGKAIGAIMIRRVEPTLFSDRDIYLLQNFANQAVIAIEKARLLDETKRLLQETTQRNAELAVINSVQQGLASRIKFQEIIDLVGEKVGEIFKADTVTAAMYDPQRDWGLNAYYVDRGRRIPIPDGPLPRPSLTAVVVDSHRPLLIGTTEESEKLGAVRRPPSETEEDQNESILFVPILAGKKVIGAISVQSYQRNAYDQDDLRLLQTLASSMSVALENARLFDETAQRNAELAVINSVQEAMAQRTDIQGIYEAVGEKIRGIFSAQAMILGQFDHASSLVLPHYFYEKGERLYPSPLPFTGLIKHLISTRQSIVINQDFAAKAQELGMIIPAGEGSFNQNDLRQLQTFANSKSAVFVPLVAGEKVIGGISLQNSDRENAFSDSDVRLLETLANSMSVALENARLFDETAQRNAELAVINSVQEAMAKQLDIKSIYEAVGEKIKDIFDAQAVIIGNFDHAAGLVSPYYFYEKGERYYPDPFPFTGLIKHLISSHETLVINEDFTAKAKEFGMLLQAGEMSKSGVFVPLVAGDKVIGAISLQNIDRENAFSASNIRLLETLANSMSVALENARLFDESNRLLEESRKKEAELTTVNTVGQAVASEVDLDALIELIGEQVRTIFKADIAYLALYDKADGMIRFPYIRGETLEPLKLGEGIVSQIIRTAEPLLINRDEGWKEAERNVDRVGVRAKSYLGVPILVGKSAIGAISVQSTQKEGRFDAADMNLLFTIAANVGSAIENARLFAEVARQKEYFETFFQYSPAAVVVVDFDGRVISWNPAAESLFGYTAQEAIGKDVDDLVANDPRVEAEARRNTQKFIGERGRVEVKGRRTRKDGSLVDVEVKGLPISVEGEMVGLLVIYHDISEIEQARRAAEEANQAKSAFLANMSHELRTPLNAIIGFTRIVRRKGDDSLPEKQLENLDKVLVSAEHLLGLINTILDIAKIEAGRMELQLSDFDLAALIDSCLATTQPLVKSSDIKLLKSMPPGLPRMHSDQEKIRQILLNLLSNAAKFTHEGSIKVNGQLKGEMIVLSVEDSGIGIAEENLHKIFEEFQQADNTTTRQYGGTGLGLSISRSLARLLDGDLTATSVEGEGSTFSLTTPLHLGKPSSGTEAGDQDLNGAGLSLEPDKPLVLVIDDQPDMFHILHQNLGEAGYQVIGALSGEQGIEKARAFRPAAITLDIMMPHMDGWQVLYELKNDPQTKNIPVIILTIVDNKPMGFRMGASDYLMKPLSEKSVLDALERLAKSNGGVRPKRLLVVDDDPKVIDLVHQMLDGKDFVIDTAKDGAEGLQRIEQIQPDVILLDLIMPKLDGFRFIHELRKDPSRVRIPIIVLTAKSLSSKELSLLQKNVSKIVKKQNLGSEELIAEIQKVIA